MQNSITYYIEDNIFPSFKKVNGEKSNPSHSSSSSLNLNPNYLGFDSSILSRSVPKASLQVELSACNSSYFYPSFVGLPLTLEMPVTSNNHFCHRCILWAFFMYDQTILNGYFSFYLLWMLSLTY